MSSTFGGIQQAANSIGTARYGLDVVSQNIANANTPGYTRQASQQATLDGVAGVPYVTPPGTPVRAGDRGPAPRGARMPALSRSPLLWAQRQEARTVKFRSVDDLNRDPRVDGILVQLPLPKHIVADNILRAIDPAKDVDGFHPDNVARLALGLPGFVPCTPLGCLRLLDESGVELKGARAVIVGRSHIVGRPMALELLMARLLTSSFQTGSPVAALIAWNTPSVPPTMARRTPPTVVMIGVE